MMARAADIKARTRRFPAKTRPAETVLAVAIPAAAIALAAALLVLRRAAAAAPVCDSEASFSLAETAPGAKDAVLSSSRPPWRDSAIVSARPEDIRYSPLPYAATPPPLAPLHFAPAARRTPAAPARFPAKGPGSMAAPRAAEVRLDRPVFAAEIQESLSSAGFSIEPPPPEEWGECEGEACFFIETDDAGCPFTVMECGNAPRRTAKDPWFLSAMRARAAGAARGTVRLKWRKPKTTPAKEEGKNDRQ